jgi:hypothetical protein
MAIELAFDVTASFFNTVPTGVQLAGYVTGSSDIVWTAAMFASKPGSIHIDQSPNNTVLDELADILDFENGAATLADLVGWVKAAQANFAANARPGQRKPAIYCSADSLTDVVNALIKGGVTSGVGLWIAHFGVTEEAAIAVLEAASGPFPVIGFQFTDTGGGGDYDIDVFSTDWLGTQSGIAGNTIAQGSSGPAVLAAQQRLNVWGAKLTPDSLFGTSTFEAAKAFQTNRKLTPDGIVGTDTWGALETAPNDPPPVSPTATPAPKGLRQTVQSTAAAAALSWQTVAAATAGYHLQVESYKPGFGWVLSIDRVVPETTSSEALAPRTQYRWRVAVNNTDHVWSGWGSFQTA